MLLHFSYHKNDYTINAFIFWGKRNQVDIIMIKTNSNPKMTKNEIKEFRSLVRRYATKDFSSKEFALFKEQKERITNVARRIISNNGGKNPILGY